MDYLLDWLWAIAVFAALLWLSSRGRSQYDNIPSDMYSSLGNSTGGDDEQPEVRVRKP